VTSFLLLPPVLLFIMCTVLDVCTVTECMHCASMCALWNSVCTVTECVHCASMCALWNSVCTVI